MTQAVTRPGVVFVSRKWPPAVGGMETYSLRLAETLEPHVGLTRIVLPGRNDGRPPSALALIVFGVGAFLRVATQHRDADVVHVADMASWPVALGARLSLKPPAIVLSAHGTDVTFARRGGFVGKSYGMYLKLGARLLAEPVVIANSAATEAAARDCGFTSTKIVPLATDFTRQKSAMDRNRLLFSGRIIPLKGLSWFVREVLENLPSVITLAVAGTVWDQTEAECLDHPRVTYLGRLDQKDLAVEFARALAVVVPNVPVDTGQFEGFGLVAIEAAAAGGVVLASDHGGLREAVQDGTTGFSLAAGDAGAWLHQITVVRNWSDGERQAFIDQASATAHETFGWERVARDTLHNYEQAMERRKK